MLRFIVISTEVQRMSYFSDKIKKHATKSEETAESITKRQRHNQQREKRGISRQEAFVQYQNETNCLYLQDREDFWHKLPARRSHLELRSYFLSVYKLNLQPNIQMSEYSFTLGIWFSILTYSSCNAMYALTVHLIYRTVHYGSSRQSYPFAKRS